MSEEKKTINEFSLYEMVNCMSPTQFELISEYEAFCKFEIFGGYSIVLTNLIDIDSFIISIKNRFDKIIFKFEFDSVCDKTENLQTFFEFIRYIQFENFSEQYHKNQNEFINKI